MSGHKLDLRKATIARLAQRYPACFYAARQRRRPLKIGIRRDLAALDLGIGRRELDSALAWYVNGIGYLRTCALQVGTQLTDQSACIDRSSGDRTGH
jgi:sRNA-binding protein